MVSLDDLYCYVTEMRGKPSAAYSQVMDRHCDLFEQLETMDKAFAQKMADSYSELLDLECQAMFQEGLRLGLEFLKL